MTRDQAVEAFHKVTYPQPAPNCGGLGPFTYSANRKWSEKAIDGFVALGMLKLDEPKSVRSKILDALFVEFGGHDIEKVLRLLDVANLKIIEA